MAKKEKQPEQTPAEQAPEAREEAPVQELPKADPWEEKYNAEHDALLRLAAEFDNFRKRTAKEKESSYSSGKADAVVKLLPVYDNLCRALKQDTQDAAFKKGVEMTLSELVKILTALGVEIFGAEGDPFDPQLHNAVLHTEDPALPENTVSQVLQQGFKMGDRVVRFAMVQVAN